MQDVCQYPWYKGNGPEMLSMANRTRARGPWFKDACSPEEDKCCDILGREGTGRWKVIHWAKSSTSQ